VSPRRGVEITLRLLLLGFIIVYAFFPIAWVASAAAKP
jgi:hypothetical protein